MERFILSRAGGDLFPIRVCYCFNIASLCNVLQSASQCLDCARVMYPRVIPAVVCRCASRRPHSLRPFSSSSTVHVDFLLHLTASTSDCSCFLFLIAAMAFEYRHQPIRAVYMSFDAITTTLVRFPYWFVTALIPGLRPRRSWSLKKTLMVKLIKHMNALGMR